MCIYRYIDRLVTCGPDFCGPKLTTSPRWRPRLWKPGLPGCELLRLRALGCLKGGVSSHDVGHLMLWVIIDYDSMIFYDIHVIHVMWCVWLCVCLWLDDVAIWWKYSLPSNPAAPWPDINLKDVVLPAPFTPKRPKTIPCGVGWRPVPGDINS